MGMASQPMAAGFFFYTVIMSVIIFPIVRLMQAQEWQRHFSGLLWRQRDN